MAIDDGDIPRAEIFRQLIDVPDQRLGTETMHDLGSRRAHPRSLTGSKYDCLQLHHPNPTSAR